MFLTRSELIEPTGGKRPSSITRWLDDQRIVWVPGIDGWPRVLRSVKTYGKDGKLETAQYTRALW